jgi:Cu/Ag efflux pump CusA
VALSGVVINDSIVLIDFINVRVREGAAVQQALMDAGERRFRPIMLTSMTTIAGLIPLMTERSFQAQLLIPMAASLAFGLMLATFLVLLLIPVFYQTYVNTARRVLKLMILLGLATAENRDREPEQRGGRGRRVVDHPADEIPLHEYPLIGE